MMQRRPPRPVDHLLPGNISEVGALKTDAAYARLRGQIVSGDYRPGHRLVISVLAAKFGCSNIPIREALRLLSAEGLVDFLPHVGARVSEQVVHEGSARETAAILDGAVTALAAPHVTQQDIVDLRAHIVRLRTVQDIPAQRRAYEDFHRAIAAACPNLQLREALARANRVIGDECVGQVTGDARIARRIADHDAILSAIARGASPLAIEMLVREHRLSTA